MIEQMKALIQHPALSGQCFLPEKYVILTMIEQAKSSWHFEIVVFQFLSPKILNWPAWMVIVRHFLFGRKKKTTKLDGMWFALSLARMTQEQIKI